MILKQRSCLTFHTQIEVLKISVVHTKNTQITSNSLVDLIIFCICKKLLTTLLMVKIPLKDTLCNFAYHIL